MKRKIAAAAFAALAISPTPAAALPNALEQQIEVQNAAREVTRLLKRAQYSRLPNERQVTLTLPPTEDGEERVVSFECDILRPRSLASTPATINSLGGFILAQRINSVSLYAKGPDGNNLSNELNKSMGIINTMCGSQATFRP